LAEHTIALDEHDAAGQDAAGRIGRAEKAPRGVRLKRGEPKSARGVAGDDEPYESVAEVADSIKEDHR
jgi:hypothetical protein